MIFRHAIFLTFVSIFSMSSQMYSGESEPSQVEVKVYKELPKTSRKCSICNIYFEIEKDYNAHICPNCISPDYSLVAMQKLLDGVRYCIDRMWYRKEYTITIALILAGIYAFNHK